MVRIYAVSPSIISNILIGTQIDFIIKTDEPCNMKLTVVSESEMNLQVVSAEYNVTEINESVIFADAGNYDVVVTTESNNVVFDSYHWNITVLTQEQIDNMPEGMPVYDTKKSSLSTGLLVLGAVAIAAFS